MEQKEEIWKQIPNFNGRYIVSIFGEIKDIKKNNFIKPHMSGVIRRNYHQVTLYKKELTNTTKHTKRVHSLMAITFLGHVYDGTRKIVVDHIDNNPLNNMLSNLRLITMKENNIKDRRVNPKKSK
jgi:hypothetical protein